MKTQRTIKFRPVRERRGRCWVRTVSADQPTAAGRCAANMIRCAIATRESTLWGGHPAQRLIMRKDALWARVFAGQVDQHDPRLDEVSSRIHSLVYRKEEATS